MLSRLALSRGSLMRSSKFLKLQTRTLIGVQGKYISHFPTFFKFKFLSFETKKIKNDDRRSFSRTDTHASQSNIHRERGKGR